MAMVFAKNGRTSFGMNFQYWKGVVRIFVADTLKKERSGSTKETSSPKYFFVWRFVLWLTTKYHCRGKLFFFK